MGTQFDVPEPLQQAMADTWDARRTGRAPYVNPWVLTNNTHQPMVPIVPRPAPVAPTTAPRVDGLAKSHADHKARVAASQTRDTQRDHEQDEAVAILMGIIVVFTVRAVWVVIKVVSVALYVGAVRLYRYARRAYVSYRASKGI